MATKEHVWFGMKVSPEQKEQIKRLAEREGTSAKEAVMRLVEKALGPSVVIAPPPGSFLKAVEDLAGSVGSEDGPIDLASNPLYLENYGR